MGPTFGATGFMGPMGLMRHVHEDHYTKEVLPHAALASWPLNSGSFGGNSLNFSYLWHALEQLGGFAAQ